MNFKKIMTLTVLGVIISSTTQVFAVSSSKLNTKRIYGSDRYETSIKISKEGWDKSSCAVICRGDNFADAICSVPLAKKYNAPILLIKENKISKETKDELERLNAEKVFIIGGEGVISKSTEGEVKSIKSVKEISRFGGRDRYETSRIVAKDVGCKGEIVLTSGAAPADALSISPIAANKNMPIILTSKDKKPVQQYLKDNKVNKSFIIGGEACVSKEIESVAPNVERIYGKDRFETNQKIIERFSDTLNFKKVYMALGQSDRGTEFADALTASTLASKDNSPMILIYKDIYGETEKLIKSKLSKDSTIVVFGGEKLIPENIVDKLANLKTSNQENTNKNNDKKGSSSSGGSSGGGSSKSDEIKYTVSMQPSFPGSFTYDLKVTKDKDSKNITGYKLVYDEKVIAEDTDNNGVVRPLTIFFGDDVDKSKFKILKDGKEIKFNGLNK
ncbi:cell wall-binding repeat-containing protein [Clostridium lundense]|uniref:cell wall-binding repeat-containing protein n=1 Tax=Clostridium lundense TaxID=319475 RepID=UPI00068657B7|nr:cell wall-binding repeat-containing protein [Clostridium lundense]